MTNPRTPEQHERLNEYVRRKDVSEFALHTTPATSEQVKHFLCTAPPEVFVLLDGLSADRHCPDGRMTSVYDSRMVAGFVGARLDEAGAR